MGHYDECYPTAEELCKEHGHILMLTGGLRFFVRKGPYKEVLQQEECCKRCGMTNWIDIPTVYESEEK